MIPISVLDLSPVTEGSDVSQSLANTLDLARHAERLGFRRYWLAEHHNMPGIASAATAVVIAHVAAGTSTIRVGAGGIMLPNHAPLVIAEQFGTLAALHPNRIDLGLGRAPGTDQVTAQALRRTLASDVDTFPQDVVELIRYFEPEQPGQRVQAVPGTGLAVPVWILGSSLYGAQLAAMLGLPYAFASHFAPRELMNAIAIYRERFQPSEQLERPFVMAGLQIVASESDDEARRLFTSSQQAFMRLRRGMPGKLPPPVDDIEPLLDPGSRAMLDHALAEAIVGSPETVRQGLSEFVARTGVDEIIVTAQVYEHKARLRSYELLAEIRDELAKAR
ncbi:LLM class flavin-dependent oxidoreductase [Mesorhizobium sp. Z1-4]|uniref:LLM class flavin-dependent oxidoreductase n=1 Tax=Mesorhizobium sp. Z1-4 TaxID=2448478 RepID=UPI000FD6C916|nr:LLM class flavin-dependent oxidoreductase [Mesorhizobium sp. Z1-4]